MRHFRTALFGFVLGVVLALPLSVWTQPSEISGGAIVIGPLPNGEHVDWSDVRLFRQGANILGVDDNAAGSQIKFDMANIRIVSNDNVRVGTDTANKDLYFYVRGADEWFIDNARLSPGTANANDLGGSTWEVKDGYFAGVVYFGTGQEGSISQNGVLLPRQVEVVTTTKTTTLAESGEVYTNTGDVDGSTITLLNDPTIGAYYTFVATAAQTVTILASAGETLEANGATCGTSITLADGDSVTLVAATGGSGAQWHVIANEGATCNA